MPIIQSLVWSRGGPEQVKELTDGVIELAFSALQRALGDATMPVPARRQQRVMSWLVCFATGMKDTIDGEMAQAAGPRLLKQGAKVVEAIETLKATGLQEPQAAERVAAARLKLYPAEGAPPLPWAAPPAQLASPAPPLVPESPAPPPLSATPPTPAPITTLPTLIVEPSSAPPPYVLAVVPEKMGRDLGRLGVQALQDYLQAKQPGRLGKEPDSGYLSRLLPRVVGHQANELARLRNRMSDLEQSCEAKVLRSEKALAAAKAALAASTDALKVLVQPEPQPEPQARIDRRPTAGARAGAVSEWTPRLSRRVHAAGGVGGGR